MHVVTKYPDGLFNWVDLTTSDVEGAKAFYSGLFGWTFDDQETDMGTIYTMLKLDGKNVAGMGPLSPDMQEQGVPPNWTSYVKHSNADAVAEKAAAAGGQVMFPPMDVMEEGRMTMIVDPTGAVFGVWQPRNHIGAQLVNMPNALVWNELQTRHPEKAKAFYAAVFGWTHNTDESNYTTFANQGRMQAGMIAMDETWDENIPSNWAVYFMVEDVAAAVEKAGELGASVMVPPTAAGEMGKFAVIQDPQGAIFTVMQFDGPVDPPPGA